MKKAGIWTFSSSKDRPKQPKFSHLASMKAGQAPQARAIVRCTLGITNENAQYINKNRCHQWSDFFRASETCSAVFVIRLRVSSYISRD